MQRNYEKSLVGMYFFDRTEGTENTEENFSVTSVLSLWDRTELRRVLSGERWGTTKNQIATYRSLFDDEQCMNIIGHTASLKIHQYAWLHAFNAVWYICCKETHMTEIFDTQDDDYGSWELGAGSYELGTENRAS